MIESILKKYESFLKKYHFDKVQFIKLYEKLKSGEITEEKNIEKQKIITAKFSDFNDIFGINTLLDKKLRDYFINTATKSLKNNELAYLILNGGMATRFGGVVKGLVDIFPGETFLSIKLKCVKKIMEKYACKVKIILMNSFATEEQTVAYIKENNYFGIDKKNFLFFNQSVSIRLTPSGDIFLNEANEPSFYSPGHGDFYYEFKNQGIYEKLLNEGIKHIIFTNVDNTASTIDPLILGCHIAAKKLMSVEAAKSIEGDKGGGVVFVSDKLQILEGFRFPDNFNMASLPAFNTNTFIFDFNIFREDLKLNWYIAKKKVEEKEVIQFERLAGEISRFVPINPILVPRESPNCRFIPIKTMEDLELKSKEIEKLFKHRISH